MGSSGFFHTTLINPSLASSPTLHMRKWSGDISIQHSYTLQLYMQTNQCSIQVALITCPGSGHFCIKMSFQELKRTRKHHCTSFSCRSPCQKSLSHRQPTQNCWHFSYTCLSLTHKHICKVVVVLETHLKLNLYCH